ncbi:dTDP-glucose 4,6-dehydratase [hydrothermal vent metagenome]|uniref:dTDP-glucose 4,6-dehydratase n=1 Tax=hydrothermal vent metagenome TaxID=652676 RepID=A0A1W1BS14_9ZZZZ
MKILITGVAGFIGFHLAKRLLDEGHEVVGLDNINDYYDVNLKYGRLHQLGIDGEAVMPKTFVNSDRYDRCKFIQLDISDRESIERLFAEEQFGAVAHLAAQAGVRYSLENPHTYIESNIVGFINILEGCRKNGIKNLSFASSSSVYGLNRSQPFKTTDHTDHPVSLYAATKKSTEMMAHSYAHLYGIEITGLRFFTVYGPWGRPDMAPMLFADAILHNRAIKVFNYGKMSRDFTYIDDIVDGIVKVINNPATSNPNWNPNEPQPNSSSAPYRIYNIGNSKPIELMDFINILELKLGIEAKKEMLPMQNGDVVSTYADTTPLQEDFGYTPATSLDSGIEKFVEWYREFYEVV